MIYLEGGLDAALAFHLLPRTAAAGLPNGSCQTPKQYGRKLCEQGFWIFLCSTGSTPVSLTSGADAARSILLILLWKVNNPRKTKNY